MKVVDEIVTNNNELDKYFFEGTEKLLEVWFDCSNGSDDADLRLIDRPDWEMLLEHVQCTIISQKSNSSMVSYVLSESSLFISKNRFILKTCGRTTLLAAVRPLLKLVYEKCGFDVVVDVFYSHKNYIRPELQHETHRGFHDEVSLLDTIFDDGAAYAFGRLNSDCWYLFTTDMIGVTQPDQTLEVLMLEVNPEVMNMFTQSYGLTAQELTTETGIADLLPGAIIDDFLFDPCGYSMNALLPNKVCDMCVQECYFTIHITPEAEFSYVSFETNVPMESYEDLIGSILDIFKPGKFLMTLMANEESRAVNAHRSDQHFAWRKSYRRIDRQLCQVKNYNVTYALYTLQPPAIG